MELKRPLLLTLAFVAILSFQYTAAFKTYEGHKVYRIPVKSDEDFKVLENLRSLTNLDFWSGPIRGRTADIMVSREQEPLLLDVLNAHGLTSSIMINDLERILEPQRKYLVDEGQMNWENYQSLDTIYGWLQELASNFSDRVTVSTIGKSTEGRDLKVVKVSSGGSNKPAIWIDATIHAREWISTSTITFIINHLVAHSNSSGPGTNNLLDGIDFYFLPVVNPDGYEYSRNTDRLWRKTRSVYPGSSCVGVDANRNFGFEWSSGGSSPDPCSITFAGPRAFSEPEAVAVRDYILNSTANFQGFVTLHSYSQLWMTPWGYTTDFPENYDEMMRVANASVAALTSNHGTTYEAGSAANILYSSSGTSRDWAKGVPKIKYVYTIELRDTGRYGFVLPPDQIIPTGEETWSGILVLAKAISAGGI